MQAARRQPGSTFKPFVYGAAFAKGMLPTDELMDTAVEIPLGGKQVWRPTDWRTPPSNEPMQLRDGLDCLRRGGIPATRQLTGRRLGGFAPNPSKPSWRTGTCGRSHGDCTIARANE